MNFQNNPKHLLAIAVLVAVLVAGSGMGAIAHAQETSASDNIE